MQKILGLIFLCSVVSSCATGSSGIGVAVVDCCEAVPTGKCSTFEVKAINLPAFLGPLMVSNFSVAFANNGLQPMVGEADLHVELIYEQEDMINEEKHADFGGHISPGGEVRFIAAIKVNIYDSPTNELVWAGVLRRLHEVSPGEYMHTGRASVVLLDSFVELLSSFPKNETYE